MPDSSSSCDRRWFLKRSALVGAAVTAPAILPSRLWGETAPSNTITIGCIGLGPQGVRNNMAGALNHPRARVVAVCDCHLSKAHAAKVIVDEAYGNTDCQVYQDFRDVLGRADIDAVMISTPDQWHVEMSLMAMRAGKHVLCEKPTITLMEGRDLEQEASRLGRVFQWGIEDRNFIKYWMLGGLARTGAIGEIHSVECGLPLMDMWDEEDPAPIPDDLDWNLWLGPAEFEEYTPSSLERMRWRQRMAFSGGSLTDWGAHLCDTAQVGIHAEETGPIEIVGTSRPLPESTYVDVPRGFDLLYHYPNNATIRVRDTARKIFIRFEGTEGWIQCEKWNGTMSASDPSLFRDHGLETNPDFWPRPDTEQNEFIDAIIDGGPTTYNPEAGHRLSTMLHLGHIAIRARKAVTWDPASETFTKDATEHLASPVYSRERRNWAT